MVVNDLGGGPTGEGSSEAPAPAHAVAREIEQAGGIAVADVHSVASPDSAEAIIQAALAAFGRLDIVIRVARAREVPVDRGDLLRGRRPRGARIHRRDTGYASDDLTLEAVRGNFEQIRSQRSYTLPASSQDEMRLYRKLIS